MEKATILIADDNKSLLNSIRFILKGEFSNIVTTSNPNLLPGMIKKEDPDVVLLDMNFAVGQRTGNEGFFWLSEILDENKDRVVILITAYGDVEQAVRAVKQGATDFILKPWDNNKLLESIQKSLEQKRNKTSQRKLTGQKQTSWRGDEFFSFQSPGMIDLYKLVDKIAPTGANILLSGENGTGKEVLARRIHELSARKDHPFVSVDLGSLNENIFEAELFGYQRGAYTGAESDTAGRFEMAHRGTIFLDEIGNIPLHLQLKLLTAIQNKSITRLGSIKAIHTDVRIICATNSDLMKMVENGEFREDLLYRINTIQLTIPSLRDRKEDIIPMVKYFIRKYGITYHKEGLKWSPEAEKMLLGHNWPGNIRELEHMTEKAVILSDSKEIKKDDFLFGMEKPHVKSDSLNLAEVEKSTIVNAIEKCDGNLSKAAKVLGITRKTLYNKIERYGL